MKSATTVRRVVLSFIGVFITVAVVAGAISVQAAATKPGITVQISPASQSITRGTTALYTMTLTGTGGFTGSVALSASGLPGGSTSTSPFDPPSLTLPGTGPNSTATSTLTVAIDASTSVGSYTFSVTGTRGKVSGSVTAGLTVNASPSPGVLTMTATPASVTMGPGSTAVYTVQLTRSNNVSGDVALSVLGGLPDGAVGSFSPSPTLGDSSILQVTTLETTKDDTYTLILGASGKDDNGVTQNASASVKLDINTKGKNFTISGTLSSLLAPGRKLPLELSLTNPNKKSISVTNLSVTLQGVTKAACDFSDYAVTQYSGPYPLVIPGSSSLILLSTLGVPETQWPQITFRNTSINQDGCKDATLNLSYSGSGQGN